ncbi:MAG TPA: TonB-dependent receptor [Burkholderiaceae bacterium]|jgi:TonB-dependent receptor
MFARTLLAVSVELALGSLSMAHAADVVQTTQDTVTAPAKQAPTANAADQVGPVADQSKVEVVTVQGTRASLARSLETKKNAEVVLDSISATELGKFPDDDVADSLSHITGVSIVDRQTGGEGLHISVRGLGSAYNIVTLNNRILATDDDGRDFAFDVLPADVISGADVLKSAQASAIEGSIGGTVNLRTARPLDNPGQHSAIRVEGSYNDMSQLKGEKVSAVYSTTTEDKHLGFLIGAVLSDTKLRTDSMGYNTYDIYNPGVWPQDGSGQPVVGHCCIDFGSIKDDKKRDALSATLEWRPSSTFTLTADALYTHLNDPQVGYNEAYYPDWTGNWSNVTVKNGLVTGMTVSNFVPEIANVSQDRVVNTSLFGLNAIWKPNADLRVKGDLYQSRAVRPEGGTDTFVVAGLGGNNTLTWKDNNNALPNIAVTLPDGRDYATALAAGQLGNDYWNPHYVGLSGYSVHDTVTGGTLDGSYSFHDGALERIDFGVSATHRIKTRNDISNDWTGGSNQYGNLYGSGITFGSLGANVVSPMSLPNFMKGAGGTFPTTFASFNIPAYLGALQKLNGTPNTQPGVAAGTLYNFADTLPQFNAVNSYAVTEQTTAAYVEAVFGGETWSGNVGLRIVRTATSASTAVDNILSIYDPTPDVATSAPQVTYSSPQPITANGSYVVPLPSVNFSWWIAPKLQLRLGAAETIARPALNQLAPSSTDGTINRIYELYYSGNANLKPIKATQADVSLEWYYQPKSALTVALFGKRIRDDITTQTTDGVNIGVAGHLYAIQQPINGATGSVNGLEVGLQHLWDNGFGVTAQFTRNSTIPGVTPMTVALGALYESGPYSANLSWDHTARYLANATTEVPQWASYVDSFAWMTAQASYELNKQFKFYVEGKNLTNSVYRSDLGRPDAAYGFVAYGRSYTAGMSIKW